MVPRDRTYKAMTELLNPLDYWWQRVGVVIAPDAPTPMDAILRPYPHCQKPIRTRMGGSEPARFLLSEAGAYVWAPIASPHAARAAGVVITPTSSRKRLDWMVDILMDPPPVPFLACSLGMSGADAAHWRMTVSSGLVAFGGAAGLLGGNLVLVDRSRFLEAVDWFGKTGIAVSDLLRAHDIRQRHRLGLLTGLQARAALDRLKASREQLADFPGVDDPEVVRLASHAARLWSPCATGSEVIE
ncbi:hypothetical protein LAZ40_00880 [Cereibacter sphaeroides]|uniref:hypothetical protein n=1 Tax=Cereibacter sphaeroides TaxID=1063 RepID=UPI001F2B9634|nr:hypothetical protein [Cereibacter sphaeroides]MCE6957624.1 hypothetical protein [Cereibacter sphaeroides]MCE6971282.1 hypothetical protein [Cereibacter sphaeroides]